MPETQAAHPQDIQSVLREGRKFDPPAEFSEQARVKSMAEYRKMYDAAEADPEKFWAGIAGELHWFQKWNRVLEWNLPWAKWFVGGKINLSITVSIATSWERAKIKLQSSGKASPARC